MSYTPLCYSAEHSTHLRATAALSLKLERFLAKLEAEGVDDDDDESLEDKAMNLAIEEIYEETDRKFKPWACNGKSIRVGEIILIIDSDTIVPEVRVSMHHPEQCLNLSAPGLLQGRRS